MRKILLSVLIICTVLWTTVQFHGYVTYREFLHTRLPIVKSYNGVQGFTTCYSGPTYGSEMGYWHIVAYNGDVISLIRKDIFDGDSVYANDIIRHELYHQKQIQQMPSCEDAGILYQNLSNYRVLTEIEAYRCANFMYDVQRGKDYNEALVDYAERVSRSAGQGMNYIAIINLLRSTETCL